MFRYFLVVALLAISHSVFSQQADSWSTYLENDQVKISLTTSDCHYPEKGVENRYLLLKIENLSASTMSITYDIDRSYNEERLVPDRNGFEFSIQANGTVQADCDNLKDGLHLFSKMLNVTGKSNLTGFELSNVVVNGKNVIR